jgi:hypothetical protein
MRSCAVSQDDAAAIESAKRMVVDVRANAFASFGNQAGLILARVG